MASGLNKRRMIQSAVFKELNKVGIIIEISILFLLDNNCIQLLLWIMVAIFFFLLFFESFVLLVCKHGIYMCCILNIFDN